MRDTLNKYQTPINWSIRIIVAAMFIFGAWAKGVAIFQFEKQLADLGFDWCIIPYVSRAIIAFELFLGIALLQPHFLKKLVIPATVLLLLAFCVHLGIIIYQTGGLTGNCGCFGKAVPMSPLSALIKNIISIGLLAWLYLKYQSSAVEKSYVIVAMAIASTVITFYAITWTNYCCFCPGGASSAGLGPVLPQTSATPIDSIAADSVVSSTAAQESLLSPVKPNNQNKPAAQTLTKSNPAQTNSTTIEQVPSGPAQRTSLFAPYTKYSKGVTTNLDAGVKVVCLFNLECDHCMATCKDIGALDKEMDMPAYLICWSEPGNNPEIYQPLATSFFKTSGVEYPYTVVGPEVFFPLLGSAPSPPRVVVLHNGNIIADWDSNSFTKEKLKQTLLGAGLK